MLGIAAATGRPAAATASAARATAPASGATVVRPAAPVRRSASPTVRCAQLVRATAWSAASAEATVPVDTVIKLTAARKVSSGDTVTVRITVAPARPGTAVELQVWDPGSRSWTLLAALTLGGDSQARWAWRPQALGRHRLRARLPASADLPAAVSGVKSVWVFDPNDPYRVPARFAHLILVDLSRYELYYYEHGRVVRVFDCVLGRPSLPTPRGRFHIYAKDAHMSGPYGPRRMRYLGDYAIHGTNEPWLLERFPRDYSHGCTRLSNAHILWLYSRVTIGTPVWNVP